MRYLHYEGLYKPIAHRNLTPTSSKLRSAVVKTTICGMLVSHYLPHIKYIFLATCMQALSAMC